MTAAVITYGSWVAVLAATLVAGYCVLFLLRPGAAVLVYAASRPLADAYVHLHLGPFSAGELWGAGLISVCIVFLAVTSGIRQEMLMIPTLFVALFAALTLWRPDTGYALSYALKFAAWLLLVLVVERIAYTASGQQRAFVAGGATAGLILLAIAFSIMTHRYGSAYYAVQFDNRPDQYTDPGQQPVGLSEFAVMALPFILYATIIGRQRRLASLTVGAIGVAVVMSFVRTTFLGLAIVLLGFAIVVLRRRRARASIIASFIPAVTATLFAIYLLGSKIVQRFSDIAYLLHTGGNKELAGSGRVFLWSKLIHSGFDSTSSILIGRGAGASVALTLHDGLNKGGFGGVWAHSDLVESFVTGGLVLCVAYVGLLAWMMTPIWQLARDPRQSEDARALGFITLAAFVAFNVMSLASGIAYSSVATIVTAILLGLVRGMRGAPGATFVDMRRPRVAVPQPSRLAARLSHS